MNNGKKVTQETFNAHIINKINAADLKLFRNHQNNLGWKTKTVIYVDWKTGLTYGIFSEAANLVTDETVITYTIIEN